MKIAVVASNGKASREVIKEAITRGYDVTAFSRGAENKSVATKYISKGIAELTKEDLAGFDAVVSGYGAASPADAHHFAEFAQHLCYLLSGTSTRLVIVGNTGSMYLDESRTTRLVDTLKGNPAVPEWLIPLSEGQADIINVLKASKDVRWSFVCPANDFQPEGERKGKYVVTGDVLTTNAEGVSAISYADFGLAIVDMLAEGNHENEHVCIRWE